MEAQALLAEFALALIRVEEARASLEAAQTHAAALAEKVKAHAPKRIYTRDDKGRHVPLAAS